jgi:hypothetical protein
MKAVLDRIKKIISKGITVQELSLSLAIGITGGLWPVPMTSFVGCTILQILFRVKPAFAVIIQACNFAVTPVELFLFPKFIFYGETLLGVNEHFDASQLIPSLQKNLMGTLRNASGSLCYGILAWCAFAPVGVFMLYFLFLQVVPTCLRKTKSQASAVSDKTT